MLLRNDGDGRRAGGRGRAPMAWAAATRHNPRRGALPGRLRPASAAAALALPAACARGRVLQQQLPARRRRFAASKPRDGHGHGTRRLPCLASSPRALTARPPPPPSRAPSFPAAAPRAGKRCGRVTFHIQKATCSSCGYPHARLRKYHWAHKALRRRTTGSGRMQYMRDLPRRAKNNFREGTTAPKKA